MGEPVLGWNESFLVALEGSSSFGTAVLPAATQALQVHDTNMGDVEQGDARPIKDKAAGRGETTAFVEGRIKPIAFSFNTAVKSRATATTAAKESAIYQAAGLVETVGGANVVYSYNSAPTYNSLSIFRPLGSGSAVYEAEHGFGGTVKQLTWEFGNTELVLKVGGAFSGKWQQGYAASVSMANAGALVATMANAAEYYNIGPGFYLCESEVIQVTANDYAGNLTILRGLAGTTAATHTAKALMPYIPALTYSGSPISEALHSVSLDGVALEATKGTIEMTTGMDHLPDGTGSSRVTGLKATRVSVKASLDIVLRKEHVAFLNKAKQRKNCAVVVTCGTAAGGIFTFSLPYAELRPFPVPAPGNDVSAVTLPIVCRDNTANDMFTLTCT